MDDVFGEGPGRRSMKADMQSGLIFLLIVACALVVYGFPLLSPGIVSSPYSDVITYHLGTKHVLYTALHDGGRLPFWRGDQFSGTPIFSSPNALLTSPFHFLFWLVPPASAINWTIWLHVLLAGWGYYFLGATLGLGRWPALLMAAAGICNFKLLMAIYAGWLSVLPSIALMPILVAVTVALVQRPTAGRTLSMAGVGFLCLHAGHLQLLYYTGLGAVGLILLRSGMLARRGEWRMSGRLILMALFAGVLAAAMAAYLLVPLISEIPLTWRTVTATATSIRPFRFGEIWVAGRQVIGHALGLSNLATLLYPEALGTPLDGSYPGSELWEDVFHFGTLPQLLAVLGILLVRREVRARYATVACLTCVCAAMDSPLVELLYRAVPGFALFRLPGRLLFVAMVFGIVLAGIGAKHLLARIPAPRRALWAVVGIVLIVAEGASYTHRYLESLPEEKVTPRTRFGQFLRRDPDLFRVASVGRESVNYGWASPLGLQLITGYEPHSLRHYREYLEFMERGEILRRDRTDSADLFRVSRWDMFDLLNVKYLISRTPVSVPGGRFRLVAEFADEPVFIPYLGLQTSQILVYENQRHLPRAIWAPWVVGAGGEPEALGLIQDEDLRSVAVVQDAGLRGRAAVSVGQPVSVVSRGDGFLSVTTENLGRGYLVISEVWHPGWHARLDGVELPLLRTNHALLGAWIPEGRHTLELAFVPLHWRWGLVVSAFSLIGFVVGIAVVARASRVRRGRLGTGSAWRARRESPDRPGGSQ